MHNKEYRNTFANNGSPDEETSFCSGVVSLFPSKTVVKVNAEDVILSAMISCDSIKICYQH